MSDPKNPHGRFMKVHCNILLEPDMLRLPSGVMWCYTTVGLLSRQLGTGGVVARDQVRSAYALREDASQVDAYLDALGEIGKLTLDGDTVAIPPEVWARYNTGETGSDQGRDRFNKAAHGRHHVKNGKEPKTYCSWCEEEGLYPHLFPWGGASGVATPVAPPTEDATQCDACDAPGCTEMHDFCMSDASPGGDVATHEQGMFPLVTVHDGAQAASQCDAHATHPRREEKRREEKSSTSRQHLAVATQPDAPATPHGVAGSDGTHGEQEAAKEPGGAKRSYPPKTLDAEGLRRWHGSSTDLARTLTANVNRMMGREALGATSPKEIDEVDAITRNLEASPAQVGQVMGWLYGSSHRQAKFWRKNTRSHRKFRENFDGLRLEWLAATTATTAGPAGPAGQTEAWGAAWTLLQNALAARTKLAEVLADPTVDVRIRTAAYLSRIPGTTKEVNKFDFKDAYLANTDPASLDLPPQVHGWLVATSTTNTTSTTSTEELQIA